MIWVSGDVDSVIVDDSNKIVTFADQELLSAYSVKYNINLSVDVTTYEIDKLQQWILMPKDNFDRELFLNFWNLCTDISVSVQKKFKGDMKGIVRNVLYDKLFDAAGPFIAENSNQVFNNTEITVLRGIIESGLTLLIDNLTIE